MISQRINEDDWINQLQYRRLRKSVAGFSEIEYRGRKLQYRNI